ncbi:MAG: virulence-associated E family protein [Acidobacteriota bacterium]|nr:virulence-associated E family protein [Acidobacteriota bacterium]
MTPAEKRKKRELDAATAACLESPSIGSIAEGWKARLLTSDKGKHLPVVANALIALRYAPEWQGVLHFDQSSLNTVAKIMPPWEDRRTLPFTWTDEDDIRVADWLQHLGIMATSATAGQAVQTVAREHPFHPILDYLEALTWDGVGRISDWLTLYLGAEPSDYARAVGAKWLIGGVARVFKPGCKNDTCLILEGQQGTLKSTALRTLAEPWFADEIADLGSKDAALQTRGVWLIELSELDAMGRIEVARVKAFMSRQTDRFRPPFGRRPIEAPRECVFAGTSNHGNYLKDETGGRRFWPVLCSRIDIADLRRDRDQLWAEAVHRYRAGENWWLDDKALVAAAADEQQQRYEGDPWDEKISRWSEGRESVSITDILEFAIEIPKSMWSQPYQNRVARSLISNGWRRHQRRREDDRKKREWVYVAPVVTTLNGEAVTE